MPEMPDITKCVIQAHGCYVPFKSFEVPENIRLVLTTITSYDFIDSMDEFLHLLQKNPNVFVDTKQGIAITKEGIEFQESLRESQRIAPSASMISKNRLKLSMCRLIGLKTGTRIRDLKLVFKENEVGEYYYPGIYVYSENGWKLYHPKFKYASLENFKFNEDNCDLKELTTDSYPLASSREEARAYVKKKKRVNQTPIEINKDNVMLYKKVNLSQVLRALSIMAQKKNTIFEVYLNVCNSGTSLGKNTLNIKEHNKELLDKQRMVTIKYNRNKLNAGKINEISGINMRNTRSLHYHPAIFIPEVYFKLEYNQLPLTDREKILKKFGINNENDWNKSKTDISFITKVTREHSRFLSNSELYQRELYNVRDDLHNIHSKIKSVLIRIKLVLARIEVVSLSPNKKQNYNINQLKKEESQLKEEESQLKEEESQLKEKESQLLEQEPQLIQQQINKFSYKNLNPRRNNSKNVIQNKQNKERAKKAAERSIIKKQLEYYRTNINHALRYVNDGNAADVTAANAAPAAADVIATDIESKEFCISCPKETTEFCRRCGIKCCSKCLKSVPAIKLTKHISKRGRIKTHKKDHTGKLKIGTKFMMYKYPFNTDSDNMVIDSTYKVCKTCFNYVQKIPNDEIIYNKLLGGKKKSVKKLIAGRKRVIHTGPRGGKYYIRIRNSKKVKIYI